MTRAPGATFGGRLTDAFARFGHLCVGIDPHPWLLDDWGLPDTAAGAREFGLRVVEASSTRVGIVKPQVAFFERHGAAGFLALEGVLAEARDAGLLVIADAKRGDVGSSAEAYGAAWLTPGSPLTADALTLSSYLGVGSLTSVIALAQQHGKGLYLLAATSNPEGAAVQTATMTRGENTGRSVAGGIVAEVTALNAATGTDEIGPLGVVLGATVGLAGYGVDPELLAARPATSVLAPGFGHQGARFDQVHELFGPAAPFTVLSVSRSVLSAGRRGLPDAIAASAEEVARCLA